MLSENREFLSIQLQKIVQNILRTHFDWHHAKGKVQGRSDLVYMKIVLFQRYNMPELIRY